MGNIIYTSNMPSSLIVAINVALLGPCVPAKDLLRSASASPYSLDPSLSIHAALWRFPVRRRQLAHKAYLRQSSSRLKLRAVSVQAHM